MIQAGKILQQRYLIEREIGRGGMGAVYLATDKRFGSKVAIKETLFTAEDFRRAFEREAQILNTLRHNALPRVSDYFSEDEKQFLVMEYIEGADLSEILKNHGAFPVKDVIRWADELLDALDYLHNQSTPIIHRDIKPQNLKLTPRGEIILLDFGLAKGDLSKDSQHSNTKSLFGFSKTYAPLEQIQGNGTDLRSDIYSLAATLYHIATGKPPVDSLTRASSIINKNIDPLLLANEINAEIPFAFANILRKALSLNADSRPNSAEMRELIHQNLPAIEQRNGTTNFSNIKNTAFFDVHEEPESVVTNIENVANVANPVTFATNINEVRQVKPIQVSIEQPREIEQMELIDESLETTQDARKQRGFLSKSVGTIAVILALCGGGLAAWYATKKSNSAQAQTQTSSQAQTSKPSPTVTPINVKNDNANKPAIVIAESTPTPETSPTPEAVKSPSKEITTAGRPNVTTLTTQTPKLDETGKVTPKEIHQTNTVRVQPTPQPKTPRANQPPQTENTRTNRINQEDVDSDSAQNNRDNRDDQDDSDGQTRQRRADERRQRRDNLDEIRRQRLEEVRRRNQQPPSRFPF